MIATLLSAQLEVALSMKAMNGCVVLFACRPIAHVTLDSQRVAGACAVFRRSPPTNAGWAVNNAPLRPIRGRLEQEATPTTSPANETPVWQNAPIHSTVL